MSWSRTQRIDAGDSSCKQFRSRSDPTESFSIDFEAFYVKWVQWWKKWQCFKIWLVFFYGDNETLIKWTICQPKQNENHQRTKDKRYPMQKPVFCITSQVRFKPASLATETSYSIEILDLERLVILLSIGSEKQRCWSGCTDVWTSWKKYSFKNVPTL